MPSALDPNRTAILRLRMDRALAARAARRPAGSRAATKGAATKRHDLTRDPIMTEPA